MGINGGLLTKLSNNTKMSVGIKDNITEFGKNRANPYASPTNVLKFYDTCECTEEASCKDDINGAAPAGESVVSVTFGEVVYDLTKPIKNLDGSYTIMEAPGAIPVEDAVALQEVIYKITTVLELDAKVTVAWESDVITIEHVGASTLASITLSASGDLAATRCCTTATVIKWAFSGVDAIGPVVFNGGAAQNLANDPYAYAGDPVADAATAAQLAADVATALTAAGLDTPGNVSVAVNNIAGAFDITYTSKDEIAATFNGSPATNCGADLIFDCP